jgi:hypothetical protein
MQRLLEPCCLILFSLVCICERKNQRLASRLFRPVRTDFAHNSENHERGRGGPLDISRYPSECGLPRAIKYSAGQLTRPGWEDHGSRLDQTEGRSGLDQAPDSSSHRLVYALRGRNLHYHWKYMILPECFLRRKSFMFCFVVQKKGFNVRSDGPLGLFANHAMP